MSGSAGGVSGPVDLHAQMTAASTAVLAVLILLYATFASRLARWWVSMPMVFVGGRLLLAQTAPELMLSPEAEGLQELTEITLALLLFADASTLHFRQVPSRCRAAAAPPDDRAHAQHRPGRAAGTGRCLPGEGLALAALLGAILAPTDAALGLPIFNNPRVPVRIRRALNVESGLNDGIVTPFVTLFIAYAAVTRDQAPGNWLSAALIDIVLAVITGTVVGAIGGWLLTQATRRGWTSAGSEQIAILGLGLVAYFGALAINGNGFIAAFIAGLVFGAVSRNRFAEPPSSPRRSAPCCRCWSGGSLGVCSSARQ